mmetsp:Transcript_62189/g.165140  ORF Transcript_62189/g.165140 Transcript_62189/m.165140 type:complete len:212 (-) Transcript_62189:741-1376(-)
MRRSWSDSGDANETFAALDFWLILRYVVFPLRKPHRAGDGCTCRGSRETETIMELLALECSMSEMCGRTYTMTEVWRQVSWTAWLSSLWKGRLVTEVRKTSLMHRARRSRSWNRGGLRHVYPKIFEASTSKSKRGSAMNTGSCWISWRSTEEVVSCVPIVVRSFLENKHGSLQPLQRPVVSRTPNPPLQQPVFPRTPNPRCMTPVDHSGRV